MDQLIQNNQNFENQLYPASPTVTTQTAQATQSNSIGSILSSVTPANTTLFGAVATPSTLYENISTLASLAAINQVNGMGQTANGQPIDILGTASQAAAAGQSYQTYNALNLAATLNLTSNTSFSNPIEGLPAAYLANTYDQASLNSTQLTGSSGSSVNVAA